MSLKIYKRPDTPVYYLIGTIGSRRIRESTGTANKRQAEEYKAKREAELWQESVYGAKSVITFAHAVAAYAEAAPRSDATKKFLLRLLDHFGETRLIDIDQTRLDAAYRAVLRDGMEASPATKQRSVLTPLQAVMEFAAIRKWCDRPAFEKPKIQKPLTRFLYPADVCALVQHAAPHFKPLLIFLACTGARMSEAIELDWRNVNLRGRRATVWQKQQNERHIELPFQAIRMLDDLPHREGRVFRPMRHGKVGEGYADCGRAYGGQAKQAWAGAWKRAGLPGTVRTWVPKGQVREKSQFVPECGPHVLRHTWASWHYALHKDLLRLKQDGGWGQMEIVTRYAKLMPNGYQEEIRDFWDGRKLFY